MASKYNTVTQTVSAVQFTFDNLKEVYTFLGYADCTFSIKSRTLSGVVSDGNGQKLSVQKNDWVVKDSSGGISIWVNADFTKNFTEAKSSE